MDIKVLLLKSLSFKKPIYRSYRIYYGQSCFIIKYVITGKILNIKSIKKARKHKSWAQRIKCNNKTNSMERSKKIQVNKNKSATIKNFEDDIYKNTKHVQIETLENSPNIKENSTQTSCVQKHVKVQTEILKNSSTKPISSKNKLVSHISTAQQTITFNRINRCTTLSKSSKCCQTDSNTECKGIQCKASTQIGATNTDVTARYSFTQAPYGFPGVASPEEKIKLLAKDFEVFVFMLNEIGDNVITQNQILCKNAEMIKQIMKMNMMKTSKHLKSCSCMANSTQTDQLVIIEKKNKSSQTVTNHKIIRKLLLFKWGQKPA